MLCTHDDEEDIEAVDATDSRRESASTNRIVLKVTNTLKMEEVRFSEGIVE